MRDVKLGNYAVIANDHTLVLGWNSAAVPLLRQMAMTKAQFPKPNALQRCRIHWWMLTPANWRVVS